MTARTAAARPAHHRARSLTAGLAVAGLLALSGCSGSAGGTGATAAPAPVVPAAPVAVPQVELAGLTADGLVDWDAPLVLEVSDGSVEEVTAADGTALDGTTTTTATGTRWTADDEVVPGTAYALAVRALDAAGQPRTLRVSGTARPADAVVTAALSPGDDKVVGIGQPVVVRLDREVVDEADRDAVVERLSVTSTPAQVGAWRWTSDAELHWRPAEFWQPGTTVDVVSDLDGLRLSGGTFGADRRTSTFTIGEAVVSTVDVAAKTMTVTRGGEVLRVLPASMGREGFETRGGTHVVLEKFEDKVMDSATLDLPAGEAAYRTAVRHAVRITNSGTFTHGAPWSVDDQGVRNVSHGCINLSPADAQWFYELSSRGDVVEVVNAVVPPRLYDAGTQDWNLSFAEWSAGS